MRLGRSSDQVLVSIRPQRKPRVVVVTGTPGVGKTKFSRGLAKALGGRHIDLGKLALRARALSGYDRERESPIIDAAKLSRCVERLARASAYDLVLDGHHAPSFLSRRYPAMAFVLRYHPKLLERRLRRKGWRVAKIRENVAAEILDVCLWDAVRAYGSRKVCEIDLTHLSTADGVDVAVSVLQDHSRARRGIVDWIGQLQESGQLDYYLVGV